ncbi:dihydrolipoamide acetyltransferase family protein [Sphingomonas oligophenolica]|uniref:Dihydrolipoamide acetyltransferase component of pyruvate dehydrogenase complex n=1 Tax=Sphingomonas oligophenolica TaxID=301154 RepID=A0ABU9YAD0_9SPHN
MARYVFKLPDIGEGIAEAEIVAWHVAVGQRVEEDQGVADMMTDKATVEMESPVSGIVVELAGEVGEQVPIGAALMVIETETIAEDTAEEVDAASQASPRIDAPDVADRQGRLEPTPIVAQAAETPPTTGRGISKSTEAAPQEAASGSDAPPLASPAVRARAIDLGIDLSLLRTEGRRVRHADLDAYLRYRAEQGYHSPHASHRRPDEAIKVIGMRRRIAENMAASKRAIPHFTYVDEIDVTALEAVRSDLNETRGDRPKLTMLPLLIAAICKTIPAYPMINARYDDDAGVVTRHGRVHLGMATQTDAGLTVPVIRDAQDRNVWQLAAEILRLAQAARASKLKPDEMGGGTLTITSLGPLGGIATTPVINRPEVAIIGPNKIVERPVFAGKEIVRAKLMNLSISCDHRVVDGWDAASFVQALKRFIETPVLLFAD